MRLDDHGAAGRQRRGRVATGDGEGERKIARGEDGDRPNRKLHLTNGWLVRLLRIDDRAQIAAIAQQCREGAELPSSASPLAGQARQTEPGLAVGSIEQFIAERFDLLRDLVEKCGDLLRRIIANLPECGDRCLHRAIDLSGCRVMEGQVGPLFAARIDAVKGFDALGGGDAGDIVMASEIHGLPLNC